MVTASAGAVHEPGDGDDHDDDDIGPKLPASFGEGDDGGAGGSGGAGGLRVDGVNYGRGLRPGEGAAMQAFAQAGARIPRRGEVGWNGDEIARMESVGFVMSGTRSRRMNEVRIRKENQVYSAEEKRALALFKFEEKEAREAKVMAEFQALVAERQGLAAPPPAAGSS